MITFVCVYKTGGDYTAEYVFRLYSSVKQHCSLAFDFVCFTDSSEDVPGKRAITKGLDGWWSKLEVFELESPCFYFDLDTIICGSLNAAVSRFQQAAEKRSIYMLTPFNVDRRNLGRFASGIMAWVGDWRYLLSRYSHSVPLLYHGDQDYINDIILDNGDVIKPMSDILSGIYSYKHHCRNKAGIPYDANVICFHGKPRPHEVGWRLQ